jgi:hypothetical protein
LDPHKLMLQISDGIISKEAWATKCKELGIEGLPLTVAPENVEMANQESLPFG